MRTGLRHRFVVLFTPRERHAVLERNLTRKAGYGSPYWFVFKGNQEKHRNVLGGLQRTHPYRRPKVRPAAMHSVFHVWRPAPAPGSVGTTRTGAAHTAASRTSVNITPAGLTASVPIPEPNCIPCLHSIPNASQPFCLSCGHLGQAAV